MMCDTVDMRVVLIGAVALVAAFYQGAGGSNHTASAARFLPAAAHCQLGTASTPLRADLAGGTVRPLPLHEPSDCR